MKIYIIMSRDHGFIAATEDEATAKVVEENQIRDEEFAGGRPSVWIQETELT